MLDPTREPLLSHHHQRRQRNQKSSSTILLVGTTLVLTALAAVSFGGRQRRRQKASSLSSESPHHREHGQAYYDEFFFSQDNFGESFDYVWRSPRYAASRISMEEHLVRDERCGGDMMREAYAFWRFGLEKGRGIQVRSVVHGSPEELLQALRTRSVSRGALVFVDVVYWSLERDPVELSGNSKNASQFAYTTGEHRDIDALCVYQHTPDLARRSRLVRSLLAYPEPLVLVMAGDVGCRLSREIEKQKTHHRIFYAGDGSPRGPWWLPQGLELARFSDRAEIYGGLNRAKAIEKTPAKDRDFLIVDSMSTNGRKPSRERLVELLATGDLGRELAEVAGNRSLSIEIDLAPESLTPAVAHGRGVTVLQEASEYENGKVVANYRLVTREATPRATSVFALAPAGDVWSSGRILEALMRGQIPIVDQTYKTHPSSSKGCDDPAGFWRLGDDSDFPHAAPFVFVDDWAQLPSLLRDLASNDTKLDENLEALARYKTRLFAYLRDKILDAALDAQRSPPSSNCTTIQLSSMQRDRQTREAAQYYGDSSTDWADQYRDDASLPGAGCTRVFQGRNHSLSPYALCFAPQCVPPQVDSFECSTI